jgi:hypothetical protein
MTALTTRSISFFRRHLFHVVFVFAIVGGLFLVCRLGYPGEYLANAGRKLFDAFKIQLQTSGLIVKEGKIVDATFTLVPV